MTSQYGFDDSSPHNYCQTFNLRVVLMCSLQATGASSSIYLPTIPLEFRVLASLRKLPSIKGLRAGTNPCPSICPESDGWRFPRCSVNLDFQAIIFDNKIEDR